MAYKTDPRVDAYLDPLPAWQRETLARVRDLVHEADPEVVETIKRTVQPYFVLDGNICAFLAAKDHVNVFLYDPIAPDPEGIVTGGQNNKTGRAIAYREGAAVLPEVPITYRDYVVTARSIEGTELHAASVVGDTVGDPFKDTSSVAMNPVIKFTTLFGLLAVELGVYLTATHGPMLGRVLSLAFFLASMVFVWRSFYRMRIEGAAV